MKAIRVREFGGPEKLVLEDVPDLRPGAGEVVVRVHAAGVNPVEAYIRTGTYAIKPSLPYTPGMDGAGEVLSVGEGVKTAKPGDRVYVAGSLSGTYAQQALCRDVQVHPLAKQITFQQGAAVGVPYSTAVRGTVPKSSRFARGVRPGAWRQRRRRHCGGTDGAGSWNARDWHRRQRQGPPARARVRSASCF